MAGSSDLDERPENTGRNACGRFGSPAQGQNSREFVNMKFRQFGVFRGTVPASLSPPVCRGTVPAKTGGCPPRSCTPTYGRDKRGPPGGKPEGLSPEKTGGNWRDCPRKIPKMRLRRCRLSQISRQTSDLVLESKFTSGRSGKSKPRI